MSQTYDATARNTIVDAFCALFNGGTIRIYDGTRPAGPATAISTQTLLAELTFGATAFGAAANGVATVNAITGDSSANATGTATWYRLFTSGGTARCDGKVSTAGNGGDLILNSVALQSGAAVSILSFTLTAPAGTAD